METRRPVSERSFARLLQQAVAARAEGLVALRDREGLRHGAWVQEGYVVGVYVAGRFDPLLALLRRAGVLDAGAYRRCLAQLRSGSSRSGALACELAGVECGRVTDALRSQVVARFATLLELAERHGFDAALERRAVPAEELSVRMPLGSLLRRVQPSVKPSGADGHDSPSDSRERGRASAGAGSVPPWSPPDPRELARRRLRTLAKALHPDCHPELDPEARIRLARALAHATAAYHGLG